MTDKLVGIKVYIRPDQRRFLDAQALTRVLAGKGRAEGVRQMSGLLREIIDSYMAGIEAADKYARDLAEAERDCERGLSGNAAMYRKGPVQ